MLYVIKADNEIVYVGRIENATEEAWQQEYEKHKEKIYAYDHDDLEEFEKDFYLYLVSNYKVTLEMELMKQGAKQSDFGLISDELIKNSIKLGRKPKDVAWGIVQQYKYELRVMD